MSASSSTILIIGATSGLGAGFARRFHAQGKTVIATGRRLDRLQALQHDLPGLEIHAMDVSDPCSTLEHDISILTTRFPAIDTVIAMAGIQHCFSFLDSPRPAETIAAEITTNLTFPVLLARAIVPHFLSNPDREGKIILVSSGLAFIPLPQYPVYCATKAAIHSFALTLRAQLKESNIKVVELAPPYVDTELDKGHREKVVEMQGGREKAVSPMGLESYLDVSVEGLEGGDGEVATGFSEWGVGIWRAAFGGVVQRFLGVGV